MQVLGEIKYCTKWRFLPSEKLFDFSFGNFYHFFPYAHAILAKHTSHPVYRYCEEERERERDYPTTTIFLLREVTWIYIVVLLQVFYLFFTFTHSLGLAVSLQVPVGVPPCRQGSNWLLIFWCPFFTSILIFLCSTCTHGLYSIARGDEGPFLCTKHVSGQTSWIREVMVFK